MGHGRDRRHRVRRARARKQESAVCVAITFDDHSCARGQARSRTGRWRVMSRDCPPDACARAGGFRQGETCTAAVPAPATPDPDPDPDPGRATVIRDPPQSPGPDPGRATVIRGLPPRRGRGHPRPGTEPVTVARGAVDAKALLRLRSAPGDGRAAVREHWRANPERCSCPPRRRFPAVPPGTYLAQRLTQRDHHLTRQQPG